VERGAWSTEEEDIQAAGSGGEQAAEFWESDECVFTGLRQSRFGSAARHFPIGLSAKHCEDG
jgi:hypothetical protein